MLGDGAYAGCNQVIVPYNIAELDGQLRSQRIQFNIKLRKRRVLVEWFFSRLKRTFRKLDHEWRDSRHTMSAFFRACCLILNFLAHVRNLYPVNDAQFDPNNREQLPIHEDDYIPE